MPLGLTVPAWYNDNYYINEKVDECNTIKFGAVEGEEFTPWTADTVRDFMAQANEAESYAPWMGYDNFVTNGNSENCSPNPLFNVMQYVYAKAAQLNAMNDGAGYGDHANNWTGQLVLDYFKAHNITAWDHFTTAGQFEDINPSNAMDLSEFLTRKAAQCNELKFADREDWDEQAVLDYYQENGINAVMVAVNSNDPNVVIVPEDAQFRVPANLNPWGINESILNPVELTTGNDVVSDDGVPTDFIADVAGTPSKSTLNYADQITGTNDADELTVSMSSVWSGFRGDGFMKGVPTINLENATANRDLAFYANGIEGVETINVDGNINLYNLQEAGITVNLSNVDTGAPINMTFTDEAIKGKSDSLTIGLDNVRDPQNTIDDDGHLEYDPVALNANDIEHLTVNSTGAVENKVDLDGIDTVQDLTITGDADLTIAGVGSYLETVDASAATGDLDVNATGATQIQGATLGAGDDRLVVGAVKANAAIEGGDGSDNLVMTKGGVYQFAMTGTEAITAKTAAEDLTLDGSNSSGLETLNLGERSSDALSGDVTLTNYDSPMLAVQSKVGSYAKDVTITDVPEINFNVGDGKINTNNSFTGTLNAVDAQALAITTEGSNSSNSAAFDGTVTAGNARSLSLSAGQNGTITLGGSSNLAQVDQIQIGGNGDVTLAGAIGTDANSLFVSAQNLVGGDVDLSVGDNKDNDGILNYVGSSTGQNTVTVDGTYETVSFYGGANNDTLTIQAQSADGKWNPGNLSGDLGSGNDRLVINGTVPAGTDLSGITGVEVYQFTGLTQATAAAMITAGQIKLPEGFNSSPGTNVLGSDSDDPATTITNTNLDVPGTDATETITVKLTGDLATADAKGGGAGGTDTFVGEVNTSHKFTMNGGTGSAVVAFGDTVASQLKVTAAEAVVFNSGTGTANSVTGTMTAAVPVTINAAKGTTNVDVTLFNGQTLTLNDSSSGADTLKVTAPTAAGTATVRGTIANTNASPAVPTLVSGTGELVSELVTANLNVSGAGSDAIKITALPTSNVITHTEGATKVEVEPTSADASFTYIDKAVSDSLTTNITGTLTYESETGGTLPTLSAAAATKAVLKLDDGATSDLSFTTLTLTAATELDLVSNAAGKGITVGDLEDPLATIAYSGAGNATVGTLGGNTVLAEGLTVTLAGTGDFTAGNITAATGKDIVIGGGADGTTQASVGNLTLGALSVSTSGGSISVNAKTSDAADKIVISSADADTVTIDATGSLGAIEGASGATLNITGKAIDFTAGDGGSKVKATVDAVAEDAVEATLTGGTGADAFTVTSSQASGVAEFVIDGGANAGAAKDSLTITANSNGLQLVTISDADATTWDKITLSFKEGTTAAQTDAVLTKTLSSFGIDNAGTIDNRGVSNGYFQAGSDYYLVTAFATDASTDVANGATLVKLTGVAAADIAGIVSAMFTTA